MPLPTPSNWMHTHNVKTNLSGRGGRQLQPRPCPPAQWLSRCKDGRARNEESGNAQCGLRQYIAEKHGCNTTNLPVSAASKSVHLHPSLHTGHDPRSDPQACWCATPTPPRCCAGIWAADNLPAMPVRGRAGDYDGVKFLTCQDVEDEVAGAAGCAGIHRETSRIGAGRGQSKCAAWACPASPPTPPSAASRICWASGAVPPARLRCRQMFGAEGFLMDRQWARRPSGSSTASKSISVSHNERVVYDTPLRATKGGTPRRTRAAARGTAPIMMLNWSRWTRRSRRA